MASLALRRTTGTVAVGAGRGCRGVSSAATRRDRHPKGTPRQEAEQSQRDLILQVLSARPSTRDSKSYLASFASPSNPPLPFTSRSEIPLPADPSNPAASPASSLSLIDTLLNPVHPRAGIVKLQGPFTDRQLASICHGMAHLRQLGLVSVIVVDSEDWTPPKIRKIRAEGRVHELMDAMREETLRVTELLLDSGADARPILHPIARLDAVPRSLPPWAQATAQPRARGRDVGPETAHLEEADLEPVRKAVARNFIPVLPAFALGPSLETVPVHADEVVVALAEAMAYAGEGAQEALEADKELATSGEAAPDTPPSPPPKPAPPPQARLAASTPLSPADLPPIAPPPSTLPSPQPIDLTPLRLLSITRTGGIPSPARSGLPHLSINLNSEHAHIASTFVWSSSHPTALSNLALAHRCLEHMPRTSSAVIVGHRSAMGLVSNLITNRPAHSASLPHELLVTSDRITAHTPTVIRYGVPIRVLRKFEDVDQDKLTRLLEASFGHVLDREPFFERLRTDLDFVIVAGDYVGAAVVTNERDPQDPDSPPVAYLDKFAVLPSSQGDGTVDFLWIALRDESFGLGLLDALNTNGGLGGKGIGRDLVWRSRGNNPVNKWYFERSSGFLRIPGQTPAAVAAGGWVMFWADAEDRLARKVKGPFATPLAPPQVDLPGAEGCTRDGGGLSVVEVDEEGRLERWARVAGGVKGSWLR